MSNLDTIKARLGSIPPDKQRLIENVSPAAYKLLWEDLPDIIYLLDAIAATGEVINEHH